MNSAWLKCFFTLAATLLMSGCAAPGLYQWGNYNMLLYQSYKSPEKVEALRQGLEVHVAKMEASALKVAPGLYAEIGTLYLQSGDGDKAISYYNKERNVWPESRALMDALIRTATKPTPVAAPKLGVN